MKKYERNCDGCGAPYVGYGKKYCSPKCQPRKETGAATTPLRKSSHPSWKGDDASYSAKHQHINLVFGKASKCENPDGCVYPRKNASRSWVREPKRFEWALIKGKKYSHNREDYMQLCASCHRKYDSN